MKARPVIQAGSERPDRKKSRSDLIGRRARKPTPRDRHEVEPDDQVVERRGVDPQHGRSPTPDHLLRIDYLQAALPGRSDTSSDVDRRLAIKNLRTALIAGAISLVVFALAWVVGLVY